MKTYFCILVFIAFLFACDNTPPVEKANDLLKKKNLPEIYELDSVYGYEDVYEKETAAYDLYWNIDRMHAVALKEQRLLTDDERETANSFNNSALKLSKESAVLKLQHELAKDAKVHVGFVSSIVDSLSGKTSEIYFDKKVKYIKGIYIH